MCNTTSSTFLTTQLNLLGWQCDSTELYIGFLILYFCLILANHKLGTTIAQKHREALSQNKRDICCLVGLNVAHTFIHIAFVLFITSNNFGFLIVSVVAHAIGTAIVYATQRGDHKHPIRSIANALKHLDEKDEETKQSLAYIVQRFQKAGLKF
jgi:hypothetical protein